VAKENLMLDLIYHLPEQIIDARKIAQQVKLPHLPKPKNIAISGMGGSGIGGEILQGLLSYYSEIPVLIVKDYSLPEYVTKDTLFFAVSHTGNTEETISAFKQAKSIGCKIICISSGGKLAQLAQNNNKILVKIPTGFPPRTAIGYLFIPFLVVLARLGIIKSFDQDITETINILMARRDSYQNQAKKLANELFEKIPIIYSTSRLLHPVANRWRTQFNELAKIIAHANYFSEVDHNEIVGLGGPSKMKLLTYLLILIDPEAHPHNLLRADLTLKITKDSYYRAQKFYPDGKSNLAKIFSLVMQGDLASYYLAAKRKVDPLPVIRIDRLKELMAKRHD
jgi:glucose/mannose-6-phosphate isomerase